MTASTDCEPDRARSEALLAQAARTADMAERGRLIDEAAWWRFRAEDAASALWSEMDEDLDAAPGDRGTG